MWINWKRKGKSDLQALEDKTFEKLEEENNKFGLDWIGQRTTVKRVFEKF